MNANSAARSLAWSVPNCGSPHSPQSARGISDGETAIREDCCGGNCTSHSLPTRQALSLSGTGLVRVGRRNCFQRIETLTAAERLPEGSSEVAQAVGSRPPMRTRSHCTGRFAAIRRRAPDESAEGIAVWSAPSPQRTADSNRTGCNRPAVPVLPATADFASTLSGWPASVPPAPERPAAPGFNFSDHFRQAAPDRAKILQTLFPQEPRAIRSAGIFAPATDEGAQRVHSLSQSFDSNQATWKCPRISRSKHAIGKLCARRVLR
jgi:hypothetical protein